MIDSQGLIYMKGVSAYSDSRKGRCAGEQFMTV